MASHHHYHPYPTAAASTPTTPISSICYCYSCHPTLTPTPYPHPPPSNPHSTPPYTHYAPPHPHFYSPHPTPPHPYNPPTQCYCESVHQNHHYFQESNKVPDQQTDRIVTSLLRRIAALESSLRRSSSTSSRESLRDAAARTIQTHFRAFLARRSRTLRQLKQLASIKTTLNILKSGKTHFDTQTVSRRAMDLLVKLDSIQGDDQLIRDGKRSIRNELTRFMKAINGVTVISRRIVKNVRNGNKARVFSSDPKMEFSSNRNEAVDKFVASVNESEEEEEEEEEEEHQKTQFAEVRKSGVLRSGLKPKQKKSVSFAENVNGQESFDSEIELMKKLSKRVEKVGILSKDDAEVDEEEGGGSSGSSDNEIMDPNYVSRKDNGYYERNVRDENENETESFLFSAPLPVKMEARAAADYINRKKGVKIVDN